MPEFKPEEWARDKDIIWAGYLNEKNVDHALIAQFWDNDQATAEEAAEFVLRSCRFAKSWFALLEKALSTIGNPPFTTWPAVHDLANEIKAEIDKAYGREAKQDG